MRDRTFQEKLRYMLRRILHAPVKVRNSGKPHAFIFATRRGGSTLIRDAIWSQAGFDYIDEPFDFQKANPYREMFGRPDADQVFLTDSNKESLLRYTDGLLSGKFHVRSQWNWLDPRFSRQVERFVVKIHAGKTFADFLIDHYSGQCVPIAFFRHPIPTSLSNSMLGWRNSSYEFLDNESFRESFLTGKQVDLCRKTLVDSGPVAGFVVNWILENFRLIALSSERSWLVMFYESLVTDPGSEFSKLQPLLLLNPEERPAFEKSLRVITRSGSVFDKKSDKAINTLSPQELIGRWQNHVSDDLLNKTQELFDAFEISLYHSRHVYPSGWK
jgi:hypothetical protein